MRGPRKADRSLHFVDPDAEFLSRTFGRGQIPRYVGVGRVLVRQRAQLVVRVYGLAPVQSEFGRKYTAVQIRLGGLLIRPISTYFKS